MNGAAPEHERSRSRDLPSGAGHRALAIDSDANTVEVVATALERVGLLVVRANRGQDALARAVSLRPDIVLLEARLSDMSGFDLCRRLREIPETRDAVIMFVTASADEIDRVVGFELGADDYVTKPFSVRELTLRVLARLRARRVEPVTNARRTRFGVLELDLLAQRVYVDSREVSLTPIEFKLLAALVSDPNRARTRAELMRAAVDRPVANDSRSVDTHVKRLRRKIGPAAAYIRTLRGVGYRFAATPEDVTTERTRRTRR